MKVSLNTVKYYLGGEVWPDVDDLVAKIGAQLGAVEEVVDYSKRYEGIVVAKVVKCEKHGDADKLSVCEIDAGTGENVQVVCGAPNVRTDMLVAWIAPGATVPATYDKDPFVIDARELRGVMSNGMLASGSELGINNDHSGLLEIDPEVVGPEKSAPGTPFKNLYNLNDWVIDLENKMFTHRPDCFGVIGVAREFAGIYGKPFKSPDWYLADPDFQEAEGLELKVVNEIPDLAPRFMAVAMSDVNVGPSPIWVQALLNRVGIKPINNIVDMTNHLSYITGQPLHAYDYDKVKALSNDHATLVVRSSKKGEKLKLLNGKEVELGDNTIMIATDNVAVGIGGVMGGTETEVDENTKNIIIECANFDMYAIRRASMEYGLFTDAVTRFNKGQSEHQNPKIMAQAMELAGQHSVAKQASIVHDLHELPDENQPIEISAEFINSRLGSGIKAEQVKNYLENVEFMVDQDGDNLRVTAPFWRKDIEIKEDIVEEVGRLHGYDKLPQILPKKTMSPSLIDENLLIKSKIRQKLSAMGANELLTYSFVHGKLLENAGQDPEQAFKLSNALSPDLQYYRLSITPSLLNHVHQNIKAGHDRFAIFELGKVHNKSMMHDNLPYENRTVAMVYADNNSRATAYYQAKKYASKLLPNAKFMAYKEHEMEGAPTSKEMVKPFDPERSSVIVIGDIMAGIVGEFKQSVAKHFKLPFATAGFELYLDQLKDNGSSAYTPLSRYPSVGQDICLEVDDAMPYADLEDNLDQVLADSSDKLTIDKQLIDIYADKKLDGKKRITFHLKFVSYDHTLTEESVNSVMSQIESKLSGVAKRI